MKPTQEQIREFWEWCGLIDGGNFWFDPEGKQLSEEIPPIDLNSLLRWAVPKLDTWQLQNYVYQVGTYHRPRCKVTYCYQPIKGNIQDIKWYHGEGEDKDPALALFWAIWGIIKEEDGS